MCSASGLIGPGPRAPADQGSRESRTIEGGYVGSSRFGLVPSRRPLAAAALRPQCGCSVC